MRQPAPAWRVMAYATALLCTPIYATGGQAATAAADAVPFAIPDSPAFSFLNVTPGTISRPNSGRSLGAGLINGIDGEGKVRQGMAFEVAPFIYFRNVSLADYKKGRLSFILSNLRLSLGSARAAGDSASTDAAFGLNIVVFDRGDPLLDDQFTKAIGDLLGQCGPGGREPPSAGAYVDATVKACLAQKTDSVVRKQASENWNATSLSFAAATGVQLTNSEIQRTRGTGVRAWGTYGHKVETWGQVLLSTAYTYRTDAPKDSTVHIGSVGARVLLGSERVNGFAEGIFESRFKASAIVEKKRTTWSAGIEFLVNQNLWVSTGFGNAYSLVKSADRTVVFTNVKWGLSQKSRLGP
jgi:hypothetical protein